MRNTEALVTQDLLPTPTPGTRPLVWLLCQHPAAPGDFCQRALALLGGRCELRYITPQERSPLAAALSAGKVSPPDAVIFGDLPVIAEDPLLAAVREIGSARILFSARVEPETLQHAVNFCGLDYYMAPPETPERLVEKVEEFARARARTSPAPAHPHKATKPGPEVSVSLQTVLLVDDEPDIRRIGQISLSAVGQWNVLTASSGAEAIELASSRAPDLILLDVMMPGLDGLSTLQRLRAAPETQSIPVIFMTAKAQKQELSRYLDTGAAGVIIKPFDPLTLPQQIQQCLAGNK